MAAALAAARLGDPIEHSSALMGFLIGAVVGLAIGVAIVAATVATGGAALAVVAAVGAGVAATGGTALVGEKLGATYTSPTGAILGPCSFDVKVNNIPAARAITDLVLCSKDAPPPVPIAQGSKIVRINSLPAARKGDKTACGGKIADGSPNVRIGQDPGTFMAIDSEVPEWMNELAQGMVIVGSAVAIVAGVAAAFVAGGMCALIGFGGQLIGGLIGGVVGGELGGAIGKAIGGERGEIIGSYVGGLIGGFLGAKAGGRMTAGHPVDVATGELFTVNTDFRVNGPLPLIWERFWISSSTIDGALGPGWHHTYDMALAFSSDTGYYVARLHDGRLAFFTPPSPGIPALNTVERMMLHTDGDTFWLQDYEGILYEFGPVASDKLRHLVRIKDANGNQIRLERNDSGYLFAIVDSADRLYEIRHDDAGRILEIHGPDPDRPRETMRLVSYRYDEAGDLLEARDARGSALQYRYSNHLITEEKRRGGLLFHFVWDDLLKGRSARCIDTWGDPVNGGEELFRATLRYEVEDHTTVVNTGRGAVSRYRWNTIGLVEQEIDPVGGLTVRQYDDAGRIVRFVAPGGTSETSSYDEFGRLVERTDAAGHSTRFEYPLQDLPGTGHANPSQIIKPDGATHTFVFDNAGNLRSHTDPSGRERKFKRDARGLPVEVSDGEGVLSRMEWSRRGELLREAAESGEQVRYTWDALSRMRSVARGRDAFTRYSRDGNGNVIEILRPDGGAVTLDYDPEDRVTRHRDALGHETRWRYDGLKFPVERITPGGERFAYRYDGELNLIGLENPKHEHYRLDYDLAGRLIRETGFDGRVLEYEFDAASRLIEQRDAGRPTRFVRDAAGRLLEKQFADGSSDRFAWDDAGRLILAQNRERNLEFGYDAAGRLTLEVQDGQALLHRYDARGRRIETVLPDGRNIEVGYRGSVKFTSVSFDGSRVARLQRDAAGREVYREAGAVRQSQSYDPQGRLVQQQAWRGQSESVFARTYTYDGGDALTRIDDARRGLKRYQYDASDRLIAVHCANPETFVVDPAGNIVSSGSGWGEAKGDRLLKHDDRTFDYDEHGNRISEFRAKSNVEVQYQYDAGNQLVAVVEHGKRITRFGYDALGRRCWKATAEIDESGAERPSRQTEFLWNGDVLLAESEDQEDPLSTVYLFEPHSFRPLAQIRGDRVYHYHLDHLGTPQELTSSEGETVWAADLKAWGQVRVKYVGKIENPLRFQGQYCDEETGLHYSRFRYYSPDQGRFITDDPSRLHGGLNLSAYARNPVSWIDPLGLASEALLDQLGSDADAVGVYRFTDSSGKTYVGSTVDQDFATRLTQHTETGKLPPENIGTVRTINMNGASDQQILNTEASEIVRNGGRATDGGTTSNIKAPAGTRDLFKDPDWVNSEKAQESRFDTVGCKA